MVAWPRTTVEWPFSDFFQKLFWLLETSKKRCLTVGRWSRDLNHCRVTVQRLFSKFSQIARNVEKTLFDSRPTVAWPPTTVTWPFSDFFQIFFYWLETSKKRCLTVGRWSRDLRPLSRDRSVTFFKKFSNCLKHPKTLFDSRPTVAWPQSLSRDRSATSFKNSPSCLIPRKTVVWQSADGRVSSDLVGTSKKCCLKVSGLSRDGPALLFPWFFFVRLHTLLRRCISRNYYYYIYSSSFRRTGQHSAYFDHLTPPSGKDQSWIVWYQMKDILGEKRIFDFGGKIPTRWFPKRETIPYFKDWSRNSSYRNRSILDFFDTISKLVIGLREFLILAGKFSLVESLGGKKFPHYKHR